MKHKNISSQSNQLLSFFNSKKIKCFDYNDAKKALPNSKEKAIRELLGNMVNRGLLMRLKAGLYYLIPFEEDPNNFMPEWHLIPKYLIKNSEYYIAYYSALQIHNLITQPSLKEQIVVSKQLRPTTLTIRNIEFQFIYHNQNHFFGFKKIWIDNYNKVICSDLEKTIIDCLFKPDYAGGIAEIASAIFISRNKINFNQLLNYTIKFKSQAVIKRLGYLLELLDIKCKIISTLLSIRSNSYTVLDTELPKQGKRSTRWRIQKNIDEETIKSAIYT